MGKLLSMLLMTGLFFLLPNRAYTEAGKTFGKPGLKYTKIKVGEAQKIGFYDSLKEVLAQDNLYMVKLSDNFYAEAVFFDRDYEKAVFVKYGFSTEEDVYGKILELSQGLLVHNKDRFSTPYALFFEGYEMEGVYPLLNALNFSFGSETPSAQTVYFQALFWPTAHAQGACLKGAGGPFHDLQKLGDWTKTAAASDHSCVINTFVKASKIQSSSLSSAEDNWKEVQNFWKSVKAFNYDVSEVLKAKMKKNKISSEKEIFFKCAVIKSLSPELLQNYLDNKKIDLKSLDLAVEKVIKAQ